MDFHLKDVYALFRTMALTHLVVVDERHAIEGIITRKDLLGKNLLSSQHRKDHPVEQSDETRVIDANITLPTKQY